MTDLGLIQNVIVETWTPQQVRGDKLRVRGDKLRVLDGKLRV